MSSHTIRRSDPTTPSIRARMTSTSRNRNTTPEADAKTEAKNCSGSLRRRISVTTAKAVTRNITTTHQTQFDAPVAHDVYNSAPKITALHSSTPPKYSRVDVGDGTHFIVIEKSGLLILLSAEDIEKSYELMRQVTARVSAHHEPMT